MAAAPAAPFYGLQTWALQVRTRIARQSGMETLHEMIKVQGTQWLNAYLEDLVKAGPQRTGIGELMKTPGKNRDGPKTRAAAANAEKAKAKIASANKENPVAAQPKKTRGFQRALLEVQNVEIEVVDTAITEKDALPKKAALPYPDPIVDDDTPAPELQADEADETASTVVPKKGKTTKGKGGKKGAKGKGKGKSKKVAEEEVVAEVEEVADPGPAVDDALQPQLISESQEVERHADELDGSPAAREVHVIDFVDILDETGPEDAAPTAGDAKPTTSLLVAHASPVRPLASSQQSLPSPVRPTALPQVGTTVRVSSPQAPIATNVSFDSTSSNNNPNTSSTSNSVVDGVNLLVSSSEHLMLDADDLDDDEVEASLSSELPVPSIPETASLSIIVEGDEPSSLSPPTSTDPLPAQQDGVKPSRVVSPPKRVSPAKATTESTIISDDFISSTAQPSVAQQPPRSFRPLASGPPRTSIASGPPPVARGSGGLRSSWLTKALREENTASTSLPSATVASTSKPISASVLQQRGEKRKSSALDPSSAPAGSELDSQPASKVRKVGVPGERELSRSAGAALRADPEENEEQGVLARVKGKVEDLLVRADKDEEKNKHASRDVLDVNGGKRTDSAGSQRMSSRLSVSDLVSVFETRTVPAEELEAPSAVEVALLAANSSVTLFRDSTTPLNSPPPGARQSFALNGAPASIPTVIVPPAAPVGTVSAPVIEGLPSPARSQGLFPPSQSTQSTATAADSDFWANMPGSFTQTTTTSSLQTTTWVDTTVTTLSQGSALPEVQHDEDLHVTSSGRQVEDVPASQDEVPASDDFADDETNKFTQSELGDSVMTKHSELASSIVTLNASATTQMAQSSSQGLLAQAGAVVSKVLGVGIGTAPSTTAKKGRVESVKSLHLAAAAQKKEQVEKDRKAARARELEERRQAAAQRRRDEEKAKDEEQKKAKAAEAEKRKREREEPTNKSRFIRKGEEEPNKKRKLTVDGDKKPELKKAPSKDALRKNMKTPTPGPSSILSKSGPKPLGSSHPALGKSVPSVYPALPTAASGGPPSVKLVSATTSTAMVDTTIATGSTSAGPSRPSAIPKKSVVPPSNLKQPLDDGRQPSQALQAQMHARVRAELQATQVVQQEVVSENIELPEIASEYSDSDDEDRVRKYPDWTQSPELRAQLHAQESWNPDNIFGAIRPLHMEEIFRTRQSRFRARTSSANWTGQDRLTPMEEMEYARRMGFS